MATFLIYIIRWAVVLTMLYSLYGLFMKRETLHSFNRVVLLVILGASMVLPMVRVETAESNVLTDMLQRTDDSVESAIRHEGDKAPVIVLQDKVTARPSETEQPIGQGTIVFLAAVLIYIIGVAVAWLRYLWALVSLLRLIRQGRRVAIDGLPRGVKVLVHPAVKTPCSWMSWMILNPVDVSSQAIIKHERAHIRLCHSFDMLLCELTCRMLWFVPFVWMLRQDLRDVHEYQADRSVLQSGIDENEYQLLLIRKATSTGLQPVVNALNQSPIKRRFTMMYKKPSRRWVALKAAYLVPLSALAIVAFARPQTMSEIEKQVEETAPLLSVRLGGSPERYAKVEASRQEEVKTTVLTPDSTVTRTAEPEMPDSNLVKADLAEQDEKDLQAKGLAVYSDVNALMDSTMQAVGARKIAEGTYVGHFQPNLYSDTVRICKVEVMDQQSQVTMASGIRSINPNDPYAYRLTLQAETRSDRTGYYIRFLQPVNSDVRAYDERRIDPKRLSMDDVLVKELHITDFYPVAMERTDKDTRLYFFEAIKTDGGSDFVENLLEEGFSRYAIVDVKTGDRYMFRSMDKSYFKLVARESRDSSTYGFDVYQTCVVFPPLGKKVDEVQLAPVDERSKQGVATFRLSEIPRKGRVITN